MKNIGMRCCWALLTSGILVLGGCRKSADNSPSVPAPAGNEANTAAQVAARAATPVANKEERHHRIFGSGFSPLIVSISPETVPLHNGNAPMGRYSLTYEINNPEKASKAYISVEVPGVGEVQRFDVDVQAKATIEFLLDASKVDLGPTVRFRAHCPGNDTNWFVMGSDPMARQPAVEAPQIEDIGPNYVTRGPANGGGVPITIAGTKFSRECTPEAQVDNQNVELQNVVASNDGINAVLPYEALQGRPVVMRHLQVNLVVYGPTHKEPQRQVTPMGVYVTASSEGTAADIYSLNLVEQ